MGDVGLKERRKRSRKVGKDDAEMCDYGRSYEDRIHKVEECSWIWKIWRNLYECFGEDRRMRELGLRILGLREEGDSASRR